MNDGRSWNARVEEYFADEGFIATTEEEFLRIIPDDLPDVALKPREDSDALFGFGPPTRAAIRRMNNVRAWLYDRELSVQYSTEVQALASLAAYCERCTPQTVVDAGCGTGLQLVFLAEAFPHVRFFAYDIAPEMARRARARVRKHGLRNVSMVRTLHHIVAPTYIDHGIADLVFTKCSFSDGEAMIPDFSMAASAQLARESFFGSDPTMLQWKEILRALYSMLRVGGRYIDIGRHCASVIDAYRYTAWEVGFNEIEEEFRVFGDGDPSTVLASRAPFVGSLCFEKSRA